jgi:hypothetical protein
MSRTDKTMPYRLRAEDGINGHLYPRRLRPGTGRYFRRVYWKGQRQQERAAAQAHADAPPARTRHSVLSDLW